MSKRRGAVAVVVAPAVKHFAHRLALTPRGGLVPMLQAVDLAHPPAYLVSYVYLEWWLKNKHQIPYRDWVMDSGAFSAYKSGAQIQLAQYIEICRQLFATDPTLTEVFALDVIGDWKASIRNTERMWEAGVPALPTYHVGSPEEALLHIAKHYPKIALGGAVGYKQRLPWARRCFARVWPKPIHGLGFGEEACVIALPWHSVDASSWCAPYRFGSWKAFGGNNLNVHGAEMRKLGIRPEIDVFMRLEQRGQSQWDPTLAQLGYQPIRVTPTQKPRRAV